MKQPSIALATLALSLLASLPAQAHVTYTGRDFGSFTGLTDASVAITNQAVTGNFGWADATDADFGDSHKSRAFRFHLDNEAWVTITAQANASATATSVGGLLPGFSVYAGLGHVAPVAADHDGAPISVSYLATLPGVAKEGAWNALADWKIGNETGTAFSDLSSYTFKGYAVDGSAANFGTAPGVTGDGLADGLVKGTFKLGAGDYSIFVGGADYAAQSALNPDLGKAYGLSTTISVSAVPEPQALALAMGGLAMLCLVRSRQRKQA